MLKRLLFAFTLMLAGCNTLPQQLGYVPKTQMEQQIATLKQQQSEEMLKAETNLKAANTAYLDKILGNFQNTSDWLYGSRLGVDMVSDKSRLWVVISDRLHTAASYAPPPSKDAIEGMYKTLQEELDTQRVSNADLAKRYDLKEQEAKAAVADQASKALEIKREQDVIDALRVSQAAALVKLQDDAIRQANAQTAAAIAANDAKHEAAIEKNKHIIMIACGSISLLALLAACFSPVFKKEAGIFAAITGGVALLVPFLEPVHLNIVFGLGLAYVAFLVISKHYQAQKQLKLATSTTQNLVNSVQDLKEQQPEAYKALSPILADRNTIYTADNKTVPDTAVITHIDSVLKDYDRK